MRIHETRLTLRDIVSVFIIFLFFFNLRLLFKLMSAYPRARQIRITILINRARAPLARNLLLSLDSRKSASSNVRIGRRVCVYD